MKKILFILFFVVFSKISFGQDTIKQTFNLINYNRKLNGLNELTWNEKLAEAAKSHSNWMAKVGIMTHIQGERPKNFLELKNSDHHPLLRIIKSGYYPFENVYQVENYPNGVHVKARPDINDIWGEIIAHGSSMNKSYPYRADICVDGWMKSPGHKAQILKPTFKEMGIAISASRNRTDVFWCVAFGNKD